jgi:ribosome-associated heat shock protein Hsp15
VSDLATGPLQRIDQWMWFARIVKSRTLAQALIERGKVRVNRVKIGKTSTVIRPGDVLTLSLGPRIVSIEIIAIGLRRGPASEAQALYCDLTRSQPPPISGKVAEIGQAETLPPQGLRPEGAGRPTKRERRLTDRFKGRD